MNPAPVTADDTAAAAQRLRDWLLGGAVQCAGGEHAGGIVGALAADGRARYVYPEITGYYLHWLAEVSDETGVERVRAPAQAAADWADRVLADGRVPATRAYLVADEERDWRNDAVFFFDLAMLVRGLCAVAEAGVVATPARAIARLVEELARFVDADGGIVAARSLAADARLPRRWSTLGGPFEVKASSRAALAARHVALPAALAEACRNLAAGYVDTAAAIPLDMLHPTLYFAEGMLVAEPDAAPAIAALLARLLRLARADGSLPEAEDSDVPRSDIIAQALRVGLLLRGVDGAPDEATLDRLAAALVARVRADGTLPFRPDVPDPQPNAWCAMFAEQALRWHARARRGLPLPAAEGLV
jgi:hypothetical protein